MTSFTRKLYSRDPAAAKAIHRLRYGKSTTLLGFSLDDSDDARNAVRGGRVDNHVEPEFDVTERLHRWSDRGWK